MLDKGLIKSIFNCYSIKKVIYIKQKDFISFIICSMQENISIEKWNNLENVLKETFNSEISLLPLSQALKILTRTQLDKGVVIEWIFKF